MNSQLREKVEEIVGKIKTVTKLEEQGCTSKVSQIITDSKKYLIKSSFKEKYREWLKAEAQVLEKLKYNNLIQVPTIYGYIEEKDNSHLIMSYENGITLTSALKQAKSITEKNLLIQSFGRLLHQLHQTDIIESLINNKVWLEDQLMKAENYVRLGQTDGSLELLEKLKLTKPLPIKQTIIHGDCTTDNVLVIDGEVKIFIDVSGMTVGDPRFDEALAIRRFVNDNEATKSFYEGYTRYRISKDEFQYFNDGLYEFF